MYWKVIFTVRDGINIKYILYYQSFYKKFKFNYTSLLIKNELGVFDEIKEVYLLDEMHIYT